MRIAHRTGSLLVFVPTGLFEKNYRLLLESGFDQVEETLKKKTYKLLKTTLAMEIANNRGLWERPVIRLFYTYAQWNEDAKGQIAKTLYSNHTSASNIGVQFEYWW
jgi:maltoporin